MLRLVLRASVFALVVACTALGQTSKSSSQTDQNAIVITFKDGHQQSFSLSDITRIEFKTPVQPAHSGGHFVGRWEVGTSQGGDAFYITLQEDGKATKTHGSPNGRWTVYGDEARITWDDGWHDTIRKAGNHYEKAAFGPGKSFTDKPDNITAAKNTEPL